MTDVWQQTIDSAQILRQQLHTHPELAWQETRTAARIRKLLTELDIPWEACAGTGTLARLTPPNCDGKARHIALRGDIDGLPIHEETHKSWSSCTAGHMHACGHDGHTATLYAAAVWLKKHESQLHGPVTLIFQPAEEGGHGALKMIQNGALEGIDEIYGWHNWPAIAFGQLICPDGLVMCGNSTFRLTVKGRGGHASQPELCRDPVLAASAITMALQQIMSRRMAPQQTAVVSVTSIEAPSGATIIPQKAIIGGSVRTPDQTTRADIHALITRISQQTALAYGVACDVEITPRYNATINHAVQAQCVRQLWQEEYGASALDTQLLMPVMASEDFSYYLQEIPGAFALVGADDGPDHQAPCHSPHYDFNDRLTPLVARLFARLAGAPVPSLRRA